MAQQTAFQWLLSQSLKWNRDTKNGNDYIEFTKGAIIKAKEMEKQQIIDAFDNGTIDNNFIGNEYYNETYNK